MMTDQRKRLLLVQAFCFPEDARREAQLMNHAALTPLLSDVDWDLHPGPLAPQGDFYVETREEFARVGVARLPIVRDACDSGRYDAIVLLGGGDPGFTEAREIGQRYNMPVTACAHAQMHIAAMLGNKFSVIDISEAHNMHYYNLVVQYRCVEKCASIRCIDFPLPRASNPDARPIGEEKASAERGARSEMLERSVAEAVEAITQDGAEVIILGCSATFWMQPYLQRRLLALGWEVPVLEGYRAAIGMAKLLAGLGVPVSSLAYPRDRPAQWRRKKVF
ncbi:MAG TPA: aspartate/glutamate racemase family protein [Acetobacteraceae bacterium]|nr:aspartate/glutamate racemase family protein [Acetobacteraceae bacterium]